MKYHADYTCGGMLEAFSNSDGTVLNQADPHLAHLKALPHRLKLQLAKESNISKPVWFQKFTSILIYWLKLDFQNMPEILIFGKNWVQNGKGH